MENEVGETTCLKNPTFLQAHCQSPSYRRFTQSFVKELAKGKFNEFKIFLPRAEVIRLSAT
jgi:hypothetical protein